MAGRHPVIRCTLSVLALLASGVAAADTLENYQDSTTRQQIERMDEHNRANAPDSTLRIPDTTIQGTGMEGWVNQLRAEDNAARAKKAEEARRKNAELRAWWAVERERSAESAAWLARYRANQNARERADLAAKQAAVLAYLDGLPADATVRVGDYDHAIDIAAPLYEIMQPLVEAAYRDYPREFAVRYGFVRLAGCPGLRTVVLHTPRTAYEDEREPYNACVMAQLSHALPYLVEARDTGDPLDKALACALMASAWASLPSFDPQYVPHMGDGTRDRVAAWLDRRVQPCAAIVPAGTPLYSGLVAPLVHQVESTWWLDYSTRVNAPQLWPLLTRNTWARVDLQDPAAVRRAYDYALSRYPTGVP